MKVARVAVTGAGGFLGTHIVNQLLATNYNVTAFIHQTDVAGSGSGNNTIGYHGEDVDLLGYLAKCHRCEWTPPGQYSMQHGGAYERSRRGLKEHDLRIEAMDLGNRKSFAKALMGCDVIIHAASLVDEARHAAEEIVATNVKGTENLLLMASNAGVRRVVYVSSAMTVQKPCKFGHEDWKPYTEEDIVTHCSPHFGPYVYSKQKAEELVMAKWRGEALSLLPVSTFGPLLCPPSTKDDPASSKSPGISLAPPRKLSWTMELLLSLILRRYYGPFAPQLTIDCVDVRDVAAMAVILACSAPKRGRFLASRNMLEFTTSHLCERINRLYPTKSPRCPSIPLPWWALALSHKTGWDRRLTPHIVEDLAVHHPPCIYTRFTQRYNYDYQFPLLDITLRDSVESFKACGVLPDDTPVPRFVV